MEPIGKETEDFSFVICGFGASIFQANPGLADYARLPIVINDK